MPVQEFGWDLWGPGSPRQESWVGDLCSCTGPVLGLMPRSRPVEILSTLQTRALRFRFAPGPEGTQPVGW